jgi:ribosomal protein L21E
VSRFERGDRVRVDIPDEDDPDHAEFHGRHGEVVGVLADDAGRLSGDGRDSVIYRVELDSGLELDFRHRDLRPPLDGER